MRIYTLALLLSILCTGTTWALVPLESLVLGDYTQERYKSDTSDPLDYLFQDFQLDEKNEEILQQKRKLALYRGYYQDARNLDNLCKSRPQITFKDSWDREQVKLSMLATLQFIGLDLTSRAIGKYAQTMNFSSEEYANLVENLTTNYCSKNISSVSLKTLKKNMLLKFEKENNFDLPDFKNNFGFSPKLASVNADDVAREQELKVTLKLFQAFCSWGTSTKYLRLLVPLVRSPVVQAFIIRQMSSENLEWNPLSNEVFLTPNKKTIKVSCDGLICRKQNYNEFQLALAKSLGHSSAALDLKYLYCEDFKNVEVKMKEQIPQIAQLFKAMSADVQQHMIGQFIALLTGVPDFFVRSDSYSEAQRFSKFSMDNRWQKWAKVQSEKYNQNLMYEEPLTLELVERSQYFNQFKREFKVQVDVNMGEFDRSTEMVGKVTARFDLKVSRKFLKWARDRWNGLLFNQTKEREQILEKFSKVISSQVQEARIKFDTPPWNSGLEKLLAKELLQQVSLFEGEFFQTEDKTFENIPIYLNYAPFALRYMKHLREINAEKSRKSAL